MVDDDGATALIPWRFEPGVGRALTVVDHASNHIPDGIDLGIDPALLETHIAWDIGAAALARRLRYPTFLAQVSRLVIDLNRDQIAEAVVPIKSDGIAIPGNLRDVTTRVAAYWQPYHSALERKIAETKPHLLVSLHSFTPNLASQPYEARPWQIGILYNEDQRAARIAISLLETAGVIVGDQLPYSGKTLNATMNRHGEGTGTPYLGIEVRQDLIGDDDGVVRWAGILRPVIQTCLDHFARSGRESA
jgi:predicted N-formylglutamate amidohydrolase